jgi:hypothetical protein
VVHEDTSSLCFDLPRKIATDLSRGTAMMHCSQLVALSPTRIILRLVCTSTRYWAKPYALHYSRSTSSGPRVQRTGVSNINTVRADRMIWHCFEHHPATTSNRPHRAEQHSPPNNVIYTRFHPCVVPLMRSSAFPTS